MDEMENTMIGRGRDAIEMIVDAGSFDEDIAADFAPDDFALVGLGAG